MAVFVKTPPEERPLTFEAVGAARLYSAASSAQAMLAATPDRIIAAADIAPDTVIRAIGRSSDMAKDGGASGIKEIEGRETTFYWNRILIAFALLVILLGCAIWMAVIGQKDISDKLMNSFQMLLSAFIGFVLGEVVQTRSARRRQRREPEPEADDRWKL